MLNDIIDDFKFVLIVISLSLFFLLVIVVLICFSISIYSYTFDKSNCNVYVDGNIVYSGRCHYIDINSISEIDSTKKLLIYSDALRLKVSNTYVSKEIVIK